MITIWKTAKRGQKELKVAEIFVSGKDIEAVQLLVEQKSYTIKHILEFEDKYQQGKKEDTKLINHTEKVKQKILLTQQNAKKVATENKAIRRQCMQKRK